MNSANLRRTVRFTRVYDASRETMFRAWTDAKQLARWWGPRGFTNPEFRVDARVGGEFYVVMLSPDGFEYPMRCHYTELKAPERLSFTGGALDAQGKVLLHSETTAVFEDLGGKTRLTLESTAAGDERVVARMLEGMEAGWSQSLEKLAGLLPEL